MSTTHDPELIDDIQDFYRSWCEEALARFAQGYPRDGTVFTIDFSAVRKAIPTVADDYLEHPARVREYFEEAIATYDFPADIDISSPTVRFSNLDEALSHKIRDVGEWSPDEIANSFALIRGQVAKRTQGKILVNEAHFECLRCGTLHSIPQADSALVGSGSNGLQEPHECKACDRQGPWVLDEEKTIESGVNFQIIRLQRPPEADGETQEKLDIQLKGDLVDTVKPGDRVAIATKVEGRISDSSDEPTMELYGEAEAIEHLESDFSDVEVDEYEEEIREIANGENPYQTIVDSVLPSHRGDELLKEAIAYQLFGGVEKELPDGNHLRGTIHIFCVGDPGVGKSTLLRYVESLAPRSVYTTGTGSTAAGLTCAAMKDDFGDGGWTLEAGALVEANNGVCCIDELDDMAEEDRAGLLESMSDQRISVSKAGMNAELPARARILAAANPDLGRFDDYEPIAEQIDVHPALLSRFDLVFTLSDSVDPEEDVATAAHINKGAKIAQQEANGDVVADGGSTVIEPPIDPPMMRAYVALAREQNPVLTDAADERIQREYAEIRQLNDDEQDAIPTTPRMVGALTRLAEAAARIRLGEHVTVDDVERAISIYRASMEDVGIDPETGEFDVDVLESGTSDAQRTRINRIQKVVGSLEEEYENGAPVDAVEDHPSLSKFEDSKVRHEIEQLKQKGKLYEPRSGYLRRTD